jgi:hypothetical protein
MVANMKHAGFILGLCLAWAGSAAAQVEAEVQMNQTQFLPDESIPVRARVINNSGQTLQFGKENWLSYSIETSGGSIVEKIGDVPTAHDFEIRSSEWAATRADLAPYFMINKPGRYAVIATATLKDWGQTVTSPPKYFDVVPGRILWSRAFGVPQSPTNHEPPEVRKYVLQQATFAKDVKLYLRLTDDTGVRTYRLFPIGLMISFAHPQVDVDQASRLHLLYQEGARVFSYTVTTPDGEIVVRQTYDYVDSAPKLDRDKVGNPIIVGGARHLSDNDLPPSRKTALTNDAHPAEP